MSPIHYVALLPCLCLPLGSASDFMKQFPLSSTSGAPPPGANAQVSQMENMLSMMINSMSGKHNTATTAPAPAPALAVATPMNLLLSPSTPSMASPPFMVSEDFPFAMPKANVPAPAPGDGPAGLPSQMLQGMMGGSGEHSSKLGSWLRMANSLPSSEVYNDGAGEFVAQVGDKFKGAPGFGGSAPMPAEDRNRLDSDGRTGVMETDKALALLQPEQKAPSAEQVIEEALSKLPLKERNAARLQFPNAIDQFPNAAVAPRSGGPLEAMGFLMPDPNKKSEVHTHGASDFLHSFEGGSQTALSPEELKFEQNSGFDLAIPSGKGGGFFSQMGAVAEAFMPESKVYRGADDFAANNPFSTGQLLSQATKPQPVEHKSINAFQQGPPLMNLIAGQQQQASQQWLGQQQRVAQSQKELNNIVSSLPPHMAAAKPDSAQEMVGMMGSMLGMMGMPGSSMGGGSQFDPSNTDIDNNNPLAAHSWEVDFPFAASPPRDKGQSVNVMQMFQQGGMMGSGGHGMGGGMMGGMMGGSGKSGLAGLMHMASAAGAFVQTNATSEPLNQSANSSASS